MNTQSNPIKHFRWRATLIRFLVNAVTIFVVVILTPKVYFVDPTFLQLLLMALVLGILNATIKPIIQFFTLPFIFISYGLVIVLINSFMIWLLARIFPEALAVDNLFWALVAGALYGVISGFLEAFFGLNEPIVPDDNPEDIALRERVDAESVGIVAAFVDNEEAKAQESAALTEVTAEEREERNEREEAPNSAAPVDAITGLKPQVPPVEGETAEDEAESGADKLDEQDDAAVDEVTVAVTMAVAYTESQALPAEEKLEFQGTEDDAAEESVEKSPEDEVKS